MSIEELKQIIDLMKSNKLSRVKFGDIEVVKDIHEVKNKPNNKKAFKTFEELDEDDQLFNPLGDLNG